MLKVFSNDKIEKEGCGNMPNISSHMAVAKIVSDILGFDSDEFYRGNLLPDLYVNKIESHYKIKVGKYMVPDIDKALKELNLKDKTDLGILTHLLLDKHYLVEYLADIDEDVFKEKKVYKDYDILNKDIIEYFNLDIKRILNAFNYFKEDINKAKLDINIKCLLLNIDGETVLLEKDKFIKFLDNISYKIAEEIKELNNY